MAIVVHGCVARNGVKDLRVTGNLPLVKNVLIPRHRAQLLQVVAQQAFSLAAHNFNHGVPIQVRNQNRINAGTLIKQGVHTLGVAIFGRDIQWCDTIALPGFVDLGTTADQFLKTLVMAMFSGNGQQGIALKIVPDDCRFQSQGCLQGGQISGLTGIHRQRLAAFDRHQVKTLLWANRAAPGGEVIIAVIGHALQVHSVWLAAIGFHQCTRAKVAGNCFPTDDTW